MYEVRGARNVKGRLWFCTGGDGGSSSSSSDKSLKSSTSSAAAAATLSREIRHNGHVECLSNHFLMHKL
jgi:hypothetical protein